MTCIQVEQPAKNITTGECKIYPTPCDVPSGWKAVSECTPTTGTQVNFSLKKFNSCDELKTTLADILSAYSDRYWSPYPTLYRGGVMLDAVAPTASMEKSAVQSTSNAGGASSEPHSTTNIQVG